MKQQAILASAVLALAAGAAEAAKPPATLQDMWKIIQQQQQEIETLKAKAGENEALKQSAA